MASVVKIISSSAQNYWGNLLKLSNSIVSTHNLRALMRLLYLISRFSYGCSEQNYVVVRPEQSRFTNDSNILSKNRFQIEVLNIPELRSTLSVEPGNKITSPPCPSTSRSCVLPHQAVRDLRQKPRAHVKPVSFRPIRIYVGGEIRRPASTPSVESRLCRRTSRKTSNIQTAATGIDASPHQLSGEGSLGPGFGSETESNRS